jgi:pimeloyl-ACP methyl ester carboxylesterase
MLRTSLILLFLALMACMENEKGMTPQMISAGYQFRKIPRVGQDSLMVAVWYPTLEAEVEYTYNTASSGLDVKGKVSYGASEINSNSPVVVFSHGFSGGGIGSVEICEALARAGYYVFAPDHNDAVMAVRIQGPSSGTIEEALDYLTNNPFGTGANYTYRISELQAVVQFATTAGFNIDVSRIVLGGHSMGGWTAMKTMDSGINPKAMFLFSMGELNWLYTQSRYFEASFFNGLDFTTAYFYGGAEYGQAVAAGLGNVYAAFCYTHSPSPSYGLLVKAGNHFTYNSQAVAPGSSGTAEQLQSINNRLVNFLNRHVMDMDVVVTAEAEDVSK